MAHRKPYLAHETARAMITLTFPKKPTELCSKPKGSHATAVGMAASALLSIHKALMRCENTARAIADETSLESKFVKKQTLGFLQYVIGLQGQLAEIAVQLDDYEDRIPDGPEIVRIVRSCETLLTCPIIPDLRQVLLESGGEWKQQDQPIKRAVRKGLRTLAEDLYKMASGRKDSLAVAARMVKTASCRLAGDWENDAKTGDDCPK